ncbi:hypothetical protein D3C72_1613770 [compost metagenome]
MDTTNTGSCTLEWFNCRRVVVAFDFKYYCQAIADIDQTRIFFSRSNHYAFTFFRQLFQVFDGVFVATVLAPHYGVHCSFIEIRGTTQYLFNGFELLFLKA